MFWWFQRGGEFLQYEAREVAADAYELTVIMPDGTARIERFTDQTALQERQVTLAGNSKTTAGRVLTAGNV